MAEYIEMDEYISRHEAIRAVQLSYGNYEATRNALYEIPAADVAPVWHGWWADKQGGFWETATCSICGEKYPTVGIVPNYCPNCGAKLDGAE